MRSFLKRVLPPPTPALVLALMLGIFAVIVYAFLIAGADEHRRALAEVQPTINKLNRSIRELRSQVFTASQSSKEQRLQALEILRSAEMRLLDMTEGMELVDIRNTEHELAKVRILEENSRV